MQTKILPRLGGGVYAKKSDLVWHHGLLNIYDRILVNIVDIVT